MRGMEYPTRRVVTIETIGFYTWYDEYKACGYKVLTESSCHIKSVAIDWW